MGLWDQLTSPRRKFANPSMLYNWARPKTVVVSQRPPTFGPTDALTPLERGGIPLLRTWQRGAVHIRWNSDDIIAGGLLDDWDRRSKEDIP
jgi:competence protein ComEC